MKYSQLDETFIHEAKITLDRHIYWEEPDEVSFEFIMPYGYGVTVYYYANGTLELSPNFIEEKLQTMVVDPYVVKNQLEENIRLSTDKSRYILSVNKDFPSIVNGKMIDAIRQKRNEVNHRILLLNRIGRNLNLALTELYKKPYFLEDADYSAKENEIEFETEFTTYLLEESNYESPEFDRILENKRLCETFKIQIVNQKVVQYLLSRLFELAESIQDTILKAEETLQQPVTEAVEPDSGSGKKKTDLRVQMLIIHYLNKMDCMNPKFHDVKKVAKIFELLLGKNEQNIRTHLGYPQPFFLEEDLELLLPLFKSLGAIADDVVVNMEKNLQLVEQNPNNKRKKLKPLEP